MKRDTKKTKMTISQLRDVDALLQSTVRELSLSHLSSDDRDFIVNMVNAVDFGSKGLFIVANADNSTDYMMANVSDVEAVAMLARMIQRIAARMKADE